MNKNFLNKSIDFSQPSEFVDTFNQSFIICSFYTPNYEEHVRPLQTSLIELNLNHYLQPISDQGHWEANTRVKPHFLLHCLKKFSHLNIVYLDADAVVRKPLDYFDTIMADMAVYETHRQKGMSHDYLTGTIFLKNSLLIIEFVEKWIEVQVNCKQTMVDQDSFDEAMRTFKNKLTVEPLKLGYIKIFDKDYDGEIYIEQFQASRNQTKLKRKLIRKRNKYLIICLIGIISFIILIKFF